MSCVCVRACGVRACVRACVVRACVDAQLLVSISVVFRICVLSRVPSFHAKFRNALSDMSIRTCANDITREEKLFIFDGSSKMANRGKRITYFIANPGVVEAINAFSFLFLVLYIKLGDRTSRDTGGTVLDVVTRQDNKTGQN